MRGSVKHGAAEIDRTPGKTSLESGIIGVQSRREVHHGQPRVLLLIHFASSCVKLLIASLVGRICKLLCAIVGRAWPCSLVGHKCMVLFMAWDIRTNCSLPRTTAWDLRMNRDLRTNHHSDSGNHHSQRAIICWAGGQSCAGRATVHLDSRGGGRRRSISRGRVAIGSNRRRRDVSRNGSDGKFATDLTEMAASGVVLRKND